MCELDDDAPMKALKSKIVHLHERNHKADPEAYNVRINFWNKSSAWTTLETEKDLKLALREFSTSLYIQMSVRVEKKQSSVITKAEPVDSGVNIYIDSDSDEEFSWSSKHKLISPTKEMPVKRQGFSTPICIDLESDESVVPPKKEPGVLQDEVLPANVENGVNPAPSFQGDATSGVPMSARAGRHAVHSKSKTTMTYESANAMTSPSKVQHVAKHKITVGGGNHSSGTAKGTSPSERRLLSALVALRDLEIHEPTHTQLAYFSKYVVDSPGFNKTLSQQRKKGHIDYSGKRSNVSLTPAGIRASPVHVSPPKSNVEVQTRWKTHLTPKACEIIDAMLHGQAMARQDLGDQVGYADAETPGCKKQLSVLKNLGILDYVEPGRNIILTDIMYPFGRP